MSTMQSQETKNTPSPQFPLSEAEVQAEVQGGEFLTFFLADEEYGLEILKVQEIIGILPITSVPQSPEFVLGVINLRGKVISVFDMRLKFGMEFQENTRETCIIVVEVEGTKIGIVVDRVSEVLAIPAEEIEPPSFLGNQVNREYFLGIGKMEGRVQLLLDIDRILTTDEILSAAERGREADPNEPAKDEK